MKKENKNSQINGLPIRNHRWQWMAGAAAGTVAGVTAQATPVTVDLSNNYIGATQGNHLNADLTGDGVADISISGARFTASDSNIGSYTTTTQSFFTTTSFNGTTTVVNDHTSTNVHDHSTFRDYRKVGVTINSVKEFAEFSFDTRGGSTSSSAGWSSSTSSSSSSNGNPSEITKSIPITFVGDPLINGGATTDGTLSVRAIADGAGDVEVQLLSYSYNETILTPYQALVAARAQISALLSSQNNRKTEQALQQAYNDLGESLAPQNWQASDSALNGRNGENVFAANNLAVASLTALARVSGVPSNISTVANAVIRPIVQADIQLATMALAADHGQGNARDIDAAEHDLTRANAAAAAGKFTTAITDAEFTYEGAIEAVGGRAPHSPI